MSESILSSKKLGAKHHSTVPLIKRTFLYIAGLVSGEDRLRRPVPEKSKHSSSLLFDFRGVKWPGHCGKGALTRTLHLNIFAIIESSDCPKTHYFKDFMLSRVFTSSTPCLPLLFTSTLFSLSVLALIISRQGKPSKSASANFSPAVLS